MTNSYDVIIVGIVVVGVIIVTLLIGAATMSVLKMVHERDAADDERWTQIVERVKELKGAQDR